MNKKIEAETGKKRKIEVDSLDSTPKIRKISIDSLEIPENPKNWNDLPVEMKLMCIGKMTEKTKVMLSMCSKFDQKIVNSERKQLEMLWFKEESKRLINEWGEENYYYITTLWTTNMSGDTVLQYDVKYLWSDRSGFERDRSNCHKLLCHFLNNFEINTLKLDIYKHALWVDLKTVIEPKKVENLQLKYAKPYEELLKFAMKFNPNTLRLCAWGGLNYYDQLKEVVKGMVDLNFEIGRKVELSVRENSFYEEIRDFEPSDVAQLATQVKATVLVNEEKYFRLELKKDPHKHIVVLHCSLNEFQFAVVSKDLAVIPDSFF